ncbi:hypothetical protein ACFV6E_15325 [Streptomyces sp. NPDC059785]|uniref:hypothetical protein n=1 Tax=Streptomyces sp. NPDC059785 TaxID=3346945 RepID=UPI0036615D3C
MPRAQNRNPTTEPEDAPPVVPEPHGEPGADPRPSASRSRRARLRRLFEPTLFLLVTAGAITVVLGNDAETVQALAGVVSAICAVWQLRRSRR